MSKTLFVRLPRDYSAGTLISIDLTTKQVTGELTLYAQAPAPTPVVEPPAPEPTASAEDTASTEGWEKKQRPQGLTNAIWGNTVRTLECLETMEAPLNYNDIADLIGIKPPAANKSLQALFNYGFAIRRPRPSDLSGPLEYRISPNGIKYLENRRKRKRN